VWQLINNYRTYRLRRRPCRFILTQPSQGSEVIIVPIVNIRKKATTNLVMPVVPVNNTQNRATLIVAVHNYISNINWNFVIHVNYSKSIAKNYCVVGYPLDI
jgi:hypothetical protein